MNVLKNLIHPEDITAILIVMDASQILETRFEIIPPCKSGVYTLLSLSFNDYFWENIFTKTLKK